MHRQFRFKALITGSMTIPLLILSRRKFQELSLSYAHEVDDNTGKLCNLKLTQVQIVFRHGARTPLNYIENYDTIFPDAIWDKDLGKTLEFTNIEISRRFPNGEVIRESLVDHHSDTKPLLKGGMKPGQLTTVGQKQAFDLGKYLNDEYVKKLKLFSSNDIQKETSVRSSNVMRTLLTARCVVAGLFGGKENVKEPLEILTHDASEEQIYPNWGFCDRLLDRFKFVEHHIKYLPGQHEMEDMNEMIRYRNKHKPLHFVFLYDIITSREAHGFPVPDVLKKRINVIEKRATEHQGYILGSANLDAVRLSTGSFLNDICTVLEKSSKGLNKFKMNLYSAHDTTLNALLMGLEQWNKTWPPYASYIAIELYEDLDNSNEYYVRVVYNKKTLFIDKESGDEFIPLERFLKIVEKYRVENWKDLCKRKPKH